MGKVKLETGEDRKDMKLSDDELETVTGAEKMNLSILHPIDSWGKVFGKLFEPFKATLDSLQERSNKHK